jgi:hypothetical protein
MSSDDLKSPTFTPYNSRGFVPRLRKLQNERGYLSFANSPPPEYDASSPSATTSSQHVSYEQTSSVPQESQDPRYPQDDLNAQLQTQSIEDTKTLYIQNLQARLQKETEEREKYKKRYRALDKIVFSTEVGLVSTEVGLAATSIAVFPIAPITAPICLGLTGLSALLRSGSRVITKKIEKHTKLELLARTHLTIINEKIVKAIEDDKITSDEFKTITAEFDIYEKLKQDIQSDYKSVTIEELTKEQEQFLKDKGFSDQDIKQLTSTSKQHSK